jgi:hypothetical protein
MLKLNLRKRKIIVKSIWLQNSIKRRFKIPGDTMLFLGYRREDCQHNQHITWYFWWKINEW